MEDGKIHLLKEMAEPLRKVLTKSDGTVVEGTVGGKVRALLLAIKAAESDVIDMKDINEDYLEKLISMDKKEREEHFLSLPREKAASYKEIFMRVLELEDFYIIISRLPEEEFKCKFNKLIIGLQGNPADILRDYILLEIKKFYELVSKEKIEGLPEPPEYWIEIKRFRDSRIAHPTLNKEFESNKDVHELYEIINKIGLDEIVEEFKQYAKKCIDIVNSSDN
jgi:hypothetical protein